MEKEMATPVSWLENPRDGGAWWAAVYGVTQSQTRLKRLSSSSSRATKGFPGGASGKEPTRQCRRTKRCGFHPWVRKIPWRRAWQPTPVLLPGESHRQRSLGGYSHKESDMAKATWHAHIQKNKCKALSFLTCPLGIDCPLVDMGSIKCLEEFLSGLGSPTRVWTYSEDINWKFTKEVQMINSHGPVD